MGNGGGEGQASEGCARFLKNSQLHDFVSLESKLLLQTAARITQARKG